MTVKVWQGSNVFDTSEPTSIECFLDDKMQVGFYVLKAKECINIVPDDYSVTTMLMVLEGRLYFCFTHESKVLQRNDAIMLSDIEESCFCEAQTLTKLLVVTSEANQDPQEDENTAQMLKVVEEKDIYTMGHSKRVALYAKRLALGYESTYNVVSLSSAASLHDLGKINTPAEILQKPGKLSAAEFEVIKKHPIDSYHLLKERFGERVASAALQHHERLDGSGYPYGLKNEQISMDARIIAVADVFDAMTCKRIYNEAKPFMEVVEYLENNTDQYDASIVAILRRKVECHELDDVVDAFC